MRNSFLRNIEDPSDRLDEEADTLKNTNGEAGTSEQNSVHDQFVLLQFAKRQLVVHFVGQVKGKPDDGDISSSL